MVIERLRVAMSAASRDLLRVSMYAGEVVRHVSWLGIYADTGTLPKGTTCDDAALIAWNVNHIVELTGEQAVTQVVGRTPRGKKARLSRRTRRVDRESTGHMLREMLAKVHARWRYDSGLPLSLKHFCLLAGKSDSLARYLISEGRMRAQEDADHGLRATAGRPPGVWVLPADAKPWVEQTAS